MPADWKNPRWLEAAIEEAKKGKAEGGTVQCTLKIEVKSSCLPQVFSLQTRVYIGIPIGSVLVDLEAGHGRGRIVASGHNMRVQTGDPTAHAEVVCVRNAGRRRDWHKLVLVSTLRFVNTADPVDPE